MSPRMPRWIRPAFNVAAAMILLYWSHRTLQLQYHKYCKANLIRVVLFNESTMCSRISGVLQLFETVSSQAVHSATTHVMSTLNAAIAVGIAVAGASAGAASMAAGAANANANGGFAAPPTRPPRWSAASSSFSSANCWWAQPQGARAQRHGVYGSGGHGHGYGFHGYGYGQPGRPMAPLAPAPHDLHQQQPIVGPMAWMA